MSEVRFIFFNFHDIFFSFLFVLVRWAYISFSYLVRAIICNTSFLSWVGWEKNFIRARKNCFIFNPCCWKIKFLGDSKFKAHQKFSDFFSIYLFAHTLCTLAATACWLCMLKFEILYSYTPAKLLQGKWKSGTLARTWAHWGWWKIVKHFPYDEKQKAQKLICSRIWKCVFVIFLI